MASVTRGMGDVVGETQGAAKGERSVVDISTNIWVIWPSKMKVLMG